jgi:hypothetical protein
VDLARQAAAKGKGGMPPMLVGSALFRAGRFDAALAPLKEAAAGGDDVHPVFPSFFLAMAHHRAGHAGEARQELDRAVRRTAEYLDEKSKVGPPVKHWANMLLVQLLRREAEELLKDAKP